MNAKDLCCRFGGRDNRRKAGEHGLGEASVMCRLLSLNTWLADPSLITLESVAVQPIFGGPVRAVVEEVGLKGARLVTLHARRLRATASLVIRDSRGP